MYFRGFQRFPDIVGHPTIPINGNSISVPITAMVDCRFGAYRILHRCVGAREHRSVGSTGAREISQTGNLFRWAGKPLISLHSLRSSTYSRLDKFERNILFCTGKSFSKVFITVLPDIPDICIGKNILEFVILLLIFLDHYTLLINYK